MLLIVVLSEALLSDNEMAEAESSGVCVEVKSCIVCSSLKLLCCLTKRIIAVILDTSLVRVKDETFD